MRATGEKRILWPAAAGLSWENENTNSTKKQAMITQKIKLTLKLTLASLLLMTSLSGYAQVASNHSMFPSRRCMVSAAAKQNTGSMSLPSVRNGPSAPESSLMFPYGWVISSDVPTSMSRLFCRIMNVCRSLRAGNFCGFGKKTYICYLSFSQIRKL